MKIVNLLLSLKIKKIKMLCKLFKKKKKLLKILKKWAFMKNIGLSNKNKNNYKLKIKIKWDLILKKLV